MELIVIGIVIVYVWLSLANASSIGNDLDKTVPQPPDDWEG